VSKLTSASRWLAALGCRFDRSQLHQLIFFWGFPLACSVFPIAMGSIFKSVIVPSFVFSTDQHVVFLYKQASTYLMLPFDLICGIFAGAFKSCCPEAMQRRERSSLVREADCWWLLA
jgi:hypothetical protein